MIHFSIELHNSTTSNNHHNSHLNYKWITFNKMLTFAHKCREGGKKLPKKKKYSNLCQHWTKVFALCYFRPLDSCDCLTWGNQTQSNNSVGLFPRSLSLSLPSALRCILLKWACLMLLWCSVRSSRSPVSRPSMYHFKEKPVAPQVIKCLLSSLTHVQTSVEGPSTSITRSTFSSQKSPMTQPWRFSLFQVG